MTRIETKINADVTPRVTSIGCRGLAIPHFLFKSRHINIVLQMLIFRSSQTQTTTWGIFIQRFCSLCFAILCVATAIGPKHHAAPKKTTTFRWVYFSQEILVMSSGSEFKISFELMQNTMVNWEAFASAPGKMRGVSDERWAPNPLPECPQPPPPPRRRRHGPLQRHPEATGAGVPRGETVAKGGGGGRVRYDTRGEGREGDASGRRGKGAVGGGIARAVGGGRGPMAFAGERFRVPLSLLSDGMGLQQRAHSSLLMRHWTLPSPNPPSL